MIHVLLKGIPYRDDQYYDRFDVRIPCDPDAEPVSAMLEEWQVAHLEASPWIRVARVEPDAQPEPEVAGAPFSPEGASFSEENAPSARRRRR
jgi:hypothetical protein